MLHQTDLGNARMDEFLTNASRSNEARRLNTRGSPFFRLRQSLARRLVLIGARLNGEESAVIGRVVILDECGELPQGLRRAA